MRKMQKAKEELDRKRQKSKKKKKKPDSKVDREEMKKMQMMMKTWSQGKFNKEEEVVPKKLFIKEKIIQLRGAVKQTIYQKQIKKQYRMCF